MPAHSTYLFPGRRHVFCSFLEQKKPRRGREYLDFYERSEIKSLVTRDGSAGVKHLRKEVFLFALVKAQWLLRTTCRTHSPYLQTDHFVILYLRIGLRFVIFYEVNMNQGQDQELVQVETVRTFPTTSGEPVGHTFVHRNAHRNDEPPLRDYAHPDGSDDHLGQRGD